jgi:hypothetical protein
MNVKLSIRAFQIAALTEIGERKCFEQGTKFAEYRNTPHEYVSIMSMIISRFEKNVSSECKSDVAASLSENIFRN